jgi:hypothetical protein
MSEDTKKLKLLNSRDEIRKAIMSAEDIPTQIVEVPEWGLAVRVKGLTGKQVDAWQGSLFKVKGDDVEMKMTNARAKLVAMCIVDENGKRVFNDGADVFDLGDKASKAINRIYEVARELSGISKEALEDIEGNFDETPSGDSISA